MINEKDKRCEYCGFDGMYTYVSKQKREESENKVNQQVLIRVV